jgi:hypothetical protein
LFIFYRLGGSGLWCPGANQPKSTPTCQKPNQNQTEPNQKINGAQTLNEKAGAKHQNKINYHPLIYG